MPNPYDPQNPVKPHYFGGRRIMIDSFKERLGGALNNQQSGGILIYGHRGVGKTSLLQKFIDIATNDVENQSNVLILYRRLSAKIDSEQLYNILLEELNSKIRERQTIVEKAKEIGKSFSKLNAFGLGIDIKKEKESLSPFQVWKLALNGESDSFS